jgi:trimeric autotransporter adhesin
MKTTISLFLTFLFLANIEFEAQAVSPSPDGCYPGFTTAEGCKALQSLTTGFGNTGIGSYALFGNSTGSFNTAIGAGALDFNTADNNTALGVAALLLNTTGTNNTANGVGALVFNNTAEENTATGAFAMYSNTEGDFNTANGAYALYFNTIGERNTAIGDSALYQNAAGNHNTAVGNAALVLNTDGDDNTAIGVAALSSNTTGIVNTATGYQALASNTDGTSNTATGVEALRQTTTGGGNTATGFQALRDNDTGDYNTSNGLFALGNLTSGSDNTALGRSAGFSVTTADNVICIGSNVTGANVSNSCYIGQIWQQPGGSQAVYVNADGKLGALVSSRRFKDEIKPMEHASEVIYQLNPVSFRYKPEIEPSRAAGFGLIAEEVENVQPDLVLRDKQGKPYTVRYDQVNAMLLNEFLKEHRRNEEQQAIITQLKSTDAEQEATIGKQQKQIEALSAGLQKLSAQLAAASPSDGGLELSKVVTGGIRGGGPATESAMNNQ